MPSDLNFPLEKRLLVFTDILTEYPLGRTPVCILIIFITVRYLYEESHQFLSDGEDNRIFEK
ncbi:MAG: hypothetical protein ACFFD7_16315, partial [Candidatus Thorarchaeota archaeon]